MTRPRRALVADDNQVVRELVAEILQMHGYGIEQAASGQEAVSKFRQGSYDLVVSDVGMPQMDGFEVLCRIRAWDQRVPVVLMTGYAGDEQARAARMGALFLQKPFGVTDLQTILGAIETAASGDDAESGDSSAAAGPAAEARDRRRCARVTVDLQGSFRPTCVSDARREDCKILDLSLSGGKLSAPSGDPPPAGASIWLGIHSRDDCVLGSLPGDVVWTENDARCGVRFAELPAAAVPALEDLVVDRLRAAVPV